MKRNTLNKILILACLLAMFGCKARKPLVVARVADTAAKPVDKALSEREAKLIAIRTAQVNFTTFSGKAKTKLAINNSSNDVTLNIRIESGKRIWVSITAIAGIEAARALITPDSIKLINRLEGVYLKKPFSYVYDLAGREVNYKMLESLLVGNAIPELVDRKADQKTEAGNTVLSGALGEMVYKLIVGPDMKATQTNLSNQAAAQSLVVTNNTFIQAANHVVPSQIDIASVVKDKKIQVNLHYTKIDFGLPLEYPFSIPARYEPAK